MKTYKVIGVGLGPFNLSLAALSEELGDIDSLFFEKKDIGSYWHNGLLFENATLQTSHIKDLVTLANPQSKYSFVNYLHKNGRLYKFLNADYEFIPRKEFARYMNWVSNSLSNVCYSCNVITVDFMEDVFCVNTTSGKYYSEHIVLGTGQYEAGQEFIAECVKDDRIIMARKYLHSSPENISGVVALVGGGQTSAEIFIDLLSRSDDQEISKIIWLTRRENLLPFDDSPFVNELYTPSYARYFSSLKETTRKSKNNSQKLASDGISLETLGEIYKDLYRRIYVEQHHCKYIIAPDRELKALACEDSRWKLKLHHLANGKRENIESDYVVLSLGQKAVLPDIMSNIASNSGINMDGFDVNDDFSLISDKHNGNKIYLQGMTKSKNGIAEPNLGMSPWRNSLILNSICEREIFTVPDREEFVVWDNLEEIVSC